MRLVLLLSLNGQPLDLLISRVLDVIFVVCEEKSTAKQPSKQAQHAGRDDVNDESTQYVRLAGFYRRVRFQRTDTEDADDGEDEVEAAQGEEGHDEQRSL